MEILITVLLGLTLIVCIVLVILVMKKDNVVSSDGTSYRDLISRIDNVNNNTKSSVEIALSNQMVVFNEKNNEKLERFQSNITESINSRFDSIIKQMTFSLSEINKNL